MWEYTESTINIIQVLILKVIGVNNLSKSPCVSKKATKIGRRNIAKVADTALSTNLT